MHKNGDRAGLLPLSALDIRASIHLRGQLPASLTRESTPKSETRLGHETFASRIQNPKYFSNGAFPFRQNCEKTRRNQLAEGIIRLWKIEDITPLKSTVVQSLLHSFLACVSHQLFRAVDSKNRDLPKPGCQGTGIKPRTTAKLQHFGTGRWLSRRPKRTNDSPGIIAENFFAAKSVNPGSSLKQVSALSRALTGFGSETAIVAADDKIGLTI